MSGLNYIPWALGGVGLAALENKLIASELPEPLRNVNLGVGGVTGFLAANPATRGQALNSLPFKQLGLFATGALDKFRRQQQSLVDTNLQTAGINRDTARLQQQDSGDRKALALAFLVPALLGGGAAAYYAYNKGQRSPGSSSRFQTVDSKGVPRGRRRVKIEVPASALPDEFFRSLVDVDDGPKAFTRLQEQQERPLRKRASAQEPGVGSMVWDSAKEFTGLPSISRAVREAGNAFQHGTSGNYDEAQRYGLASVGNAAFGALGLQTIPWVAGRVLTQPRLADWRNSRKPSLAGLTELKFPHLGNWMWRHSFGNQMSPEQIKARAEISGSGRLAPADPARGTTGKLDTRGALDRARDIKYRYNPAKFDWSNPSPSNSGFGRLFNEHLTARRVGPLSTSITGRASDVLRYGANRAVNSAYWLKQLARRNPMASLFALGLPLSGMGVLRDDENLKKVQQGRAANSFFTAPSRNGAPVSQTLDSILNLIGGGQQAPILGQLRGPAS